MNPSTRIVLLVLLLVGTASVLAPVSRADDSIPPIPPAPPAGSVPAPAAPPSTAGNTDWRVGDELEIRVLGRTDLSGSVRVLADGTIDVPFSGRFRLLGRTIEEVTADVEKGFGKQEKSPQVAISVTTLAADEFFVIGEAGKAGVYSVPRFKRVSLLQALGMAGGFGPEADFTQVKLIPAGGGGPRLVDASPARVGALASVYVANGDTIVVPSVGRIYLMGQVGRTGGFAPPAGERMTLTRALALGGGFTRLASQTDVRVTWQNAAGQQTSNVFNVKAILAGSAEDVVVFPGNLIFVPERLF